MELLSQWFQLLPHLRFKIMDADEEAEGKVALVLTLSAKSLDWEQFRRDAICYLHGPRF